MTISVWRYSHLALAVSSFLFITIAAVTGIILSFQPVVEKIPSYRAAGFDTITLAQAIPAIKRSFDEITEINVDVNQFVTVKGIDTAGNNASVYVNPHTGKILAATPQKKEFFQWVTALHRSLFVHETGRFIIGLTAFFLLLIAISGTVLVIQRQRGIKRFFKKIVKENFAQYYHVVLGRISLVVIVIIAASGVYLSLDRFNIFPEQKTAHKIDVDNLKTEPTLSPDQFFSFKNTLLSSVQSIEFPFSDDVEDYYTVKLDDREMVINQITGDVLSEIKYSKTNLVANLSLDLHTGRKSIIWAIILCIACINILFFIYSGFVITLKRTKNKIRNKYKAKDSNFIILVGSENGSTLRFAKLVQSHLIDNAQTVHITELNHYKLFPKAEQFIILTATYGIGDAPTNANCFLNLLNKFPQAQRIQFSVVGFGSHAYPDFCRFAFDTNNQLTKQSWASSLVEIHTVNDKSPEQFGLWFETWSQKLGFPIKSMPDINFGKPIGLKQMMVLSKTAVTNEDGPFLIRFKPSWLQSFNSGDLLAIFPANDHRERLYSIGKIGKEIQLSVKLHANGLGSSFLNQLKAGQAIHARIISNTHFQFPLRASKVIMISNGTGIAPFLGMIDQNNKKIDCHLYCGFRESASFALYKDDLIKNISMKKLSLMHVAYSREGARQYVRDLLQNDSAFIIDTLMNGGVLMLCGSLSMQKDVLALLDVICIETAGKAIGHYQAGGQILMDCY